MSDSPMIERSASSFDSSTSSPLTAHPPPIRVRVVEEIDEGTTRPHYEIKPEGALLEEKFTTQLRVTAPPITTLDANNNDHNNNCSGIDREELPKHGVDVGGVSRRPPLPIALQQRMISGGLNLVVTSNNNDLPHGFNLPSPDSVKSEGSTTSGPSHSKTTLHQDDASNERISNNQNQNLTTQDTTKYIYPTPHHYISTHAQIPSNPPVYATQQHIYPQLNHQQYPMYLLTQPYDVSQATLVPPTQIGHAQPMVYSSRATTTATTTPQYQQYLNYNNVGVHSNNHGHLKYGQNQVYYTGQLGATPAIPMGAPQYQSITPAQAAMIAEASLNLPTTECTMQQLTP